MTLVYFVVVKVFVVCVLNLIILSLLLRLFIAVGYLEVILLHISNIACSTTWRRVLPETYTKFSGIIVITTARLVVLLLVCNVYSPQNGRTI